MENDADRQIDTIMRVAGQLTDKQQTALVQAHRTIDGHAWDDAYDRARQHATGHYRQLVDDAHTSNTAKFQAWAGDWRAPLQELMRAHSRTVFRTNWTVLAAALCVGFFVPPVNQWPLLLVVLGALALSFVVGVVQVRVLTSALLRRRANQMLTVSWAVCGTVLAVAAGDQISAEDHTLLTQAWEGSILPLHT